MLEEAGVPLTVAAEDYAQCRKLLGDIPLRSAIEDFLHRTRGVKLGVTVPQIVEELIAAKKQDGVSDHYMDQLHSILGIFSRAFTGPIMDVKSEEIDAWLRSKKIAPITRNNRLTTLRLLFGFAKERNYLPAGDPTAPDQLKKVKVGATDNEVFEPGQMEKLLLAAPELLIPYLAIRAFAGLRGAELGRLDWKAVNLERRIIELRAGQAKTASRRIVPISDNLAAWLSLVQDREGPVITQKAIPRKSAILAKEIGLPWPKNVLRHSYISYRLATLQNANQVALEAGNSPTIIFKHYRELVTEEAAGAWFAITPPDGWVPPEEKRVRRRKRKK